MNKTIMTHISSPYYPPQAGSIPPKNRQRSDYAHFSRKSDHMEADMNQNADETHPKVRDG